jgi:hypothetical protein
MRIPTNRALPSAPAATAPVSMVLLDITQLLVVCPGFSWRLHRG